MKKDAQAPPGASAEREMQLQQKIIDAITISPLYIIGFADIEGLLDGRLKKYRYAISIGRRLNDSIIDGIANGPTKEYYAIYRETNRELESKLIEIGNLLENSGLKHVLIKPTLEGNELDEDYYKTLRTPFSHKMAATRSGLGWIGKTDLLISKAFGPRVRFVSILIENDSIEFATGVPVSQSKCGECNKCVIHCPANAATGKKWNVQTDRDEFFNAYKCREKCRELAKNNLDANASICGICISVCPIGKRQKK
ncbi:MAG: hypothetical protein GF350_06790 [Chitinivibrionales bacterium]|nr:hypothetical protein [Chitinivibrionales bacterium]